VTERPLFMETLGIVIERADAGEAVVRMDVPETLMSPFGQVLGGAIAALFDTALAIAVARQVEPEDRVATHALNVAYVAFSRERRLVCHARVVSLRRSVATAEGEVTDGAGALLAKALGTFGVRRQES
jgi:uncharacterized protein (TIGR00369 family)